MLEDVLCELGHNPKILNCHDEITNIDIQVTCKLNKDITKEQLKIFFNKVYSMKLDQGYSQSFTKNYSTYDLITCFQAILIENNLINLQQIKTILNEKIKPNANPAKYAIQEFFDMFVITKVSELELPQLDTDNSLIELEWSKNKSSKARIKIKNKSHVTVA